MKRLQAIEPKDWESFVGNGVVVLMLGKKDCAACQEWTLELVQALDENSLPEGVSYGKLLLDQPGLGSFKKVNGDWLKDLDVLPFNVIYKDGRIVKSYAGSGADRLSKRLLKVLSGE